MKRPSFIVVALLSKCLNVHPCQGLIDLQSVPNTPTSKYVKVVWRKWPKVSKGACLKALASFTDFNGRCCVHTLVFSNRSKSRDRWNSCQQVPYSICCVTLTSVFCRRAVQLPKKPFPRLRGFVSKGGYLSKNSGLLWAIRFYLQSSPSFRWHPKYNGMISHELHQNPIFYRAPGPCHLPYMNMRPAQHLRTRGFLEWSNLSTL